jgi:DNA-binding transcriptional MocR family regulator
MINPMRHFQPASLAEQVAHHLREEIRQGTLTRTVPGVHCLAAELGVHHTTAEAALKLLVKEGLLLPQGKGKRRRIQSTEQLSPPSLRIAILPYEDTNCVMLLGMQYKLQAAGHSVGFTDKTLRDLGMNAKRVAKFVNACDVDAWIVAAGPHEVLEWFASQEKPAFSVFSRRENISIASIGPDKLPDWKDDGDDYRRCLDSLFRFTPPTALIIDESFLFHVTHCHLASMRLRVPQDVSQ